jgi:hypothetical protein
MNPANQVKPRFADGPWNRRLQSDYMKTNLTKYLVLTLTGLSVWAMGAVSARANTLITFSVDMANVPATNFNPPPPAGTGTNSVYVFGTFNGWSGPGVQLIQQGTSTVYTNTANDTSDPNNGTVNYRFNINGNNETTASYDNRASRLPVNSGDSLVLPTPFYGDVGAGSVINVTFQMDMSEEIQLGHFNPTTDQLDIRGSFNGWSNTGAFLTNDPSLIVTNGGGILTTNVYTLTIPITQGAQVPGIPATNAAMEWKAVEDPSGAWESPQYPNSDDSGNRFWFNNTNQVLPIVSYGDLQFSPLANVTLNIDMSGVVKYDTNYVPNSVTVWGTFNNWANGVQLTNNPSAPNPNVFSGPTVMPEGTAVIIQYRYTNSLVAGGWVYDYTGDAVYNNNGRRTITLPVTTTSIATNYPVAQFLDLALGDYLPVPTPVLFTVDMTGTVGTDAHVFDPESDAVYINGMFANGGGIPYPQSWYAWSGGVNPVSAPAGYQMMRVGTSSIYTNTIVIPAGTPVAISYQYGIDPGSINGGPLENEAPSGANHFRVIRSTALNPYVLPTDVFTNQPYLEPVFAPGNLYEFMGTPGGGNLNVGTSVGGNIPISWLGRPGAHLQMATLLTGPWQDVAGTDGTNAATGTVTPNGLMTTTNWPAAGNTFFRLVKP